MSKFICTKLTARITQIMDPIGVSCFLAQGKAAFRAAESREDFSRLDGKHGNIVYSQMTKK